MIPLLTRIEQQLATCTDPRQRAELLAEKGCYLARTGDFEGANGIIGILRQAYGDGRDGRVTVWIMLLEGLVLYFERLSSSARDRILRANALAVAGRMQRLVGLTAAWCAHLDFERSAYSSMGSHIATAMAIVGADEHDVHSRLGIVLGDANMSVGSRVNAQYWYEHARHHALQIGDQAAVGAIMYNRPAFALASMRVMHHLDGSVFDLDQLRFIDMELRSAEGFQVGTRVTALAHLLDVARARAAICVGRYAEAGRVLRSIVGKSVDYEDRSNRTFIDADIALCHRGTGDLQSAYAIVQSVDPAQLQALHLDDRVVAASIIYTIVSEYQGIEAAAAHFKSLEEASGQYYADVNALSHSLANATLELDLMRGKVL